MIFCGKVQPSHKKSSQHLPFPNETAFYLTQVGIDAIIDFNYFDGDRIALSKQTFVLSSAVGNALTNFSDFATVFDDFDAQFSPAIIVLNPFTGNIFYNPNRDFSGFARDGAGGLFAAVQGTGADNPALNFTVVQ